ncbi:chlorophyllase/cutinase-like alpha/beta fold protein [Terrisporobacter mayombei]|uniref:Alpha/beta hydrolase n=1 Tax=Terrisporobacter mayombei TaxID=1541 RepID=A0ABY9PWT3_9FIRM|nr:dienelactone hydrolase family protein [Terrisporobacter mayombei]MCC3867983.1 dienelactone hydrolase family protein [Terrisporobacter mayombei]WMT80117.1 hypothetical protein TEMA_04300 [Terrisporobacter mayombei]
MKISKKVLSLIIVSTMILSVGCSLKSNNIQSNTTTIENKSINAKDKGKYSEETIEFDLGNETYTSDYGKEMPYKLRGVISVPKGEGKFPIVLITHGSHNNEKTGVRFDTGFKYLTQKLAENGYIAVSIDAQNAYVWSYGDNDDYIKVPVMMDKHIQKLRDANDGKEKGYSIDLKDKIDFEKMALVGHSRGGETIFRIAEQEEVKGQKISAMLSIAPTMSLEDTPYSQTDIPTSIVMGEYDGDVITYDGIGIYDKLDTEKRQSPISLAFLEKANHNYFNDNIKINDADILIYDVNDQLSKERQENFLANYGLDFFNATLKNEVNKSVYDTKTTSPNKMYGEKVKTLYKDKNTKSIASVESTKEYKSEGVTIEATQDSWFYKYDKLQPVDTATHGVKETSARKLLTMKWEKLDSKVSFEPAEKDFEKYNSISLNLLQDPSDKLNKKDENQQFTIQIKDKKGNTSNVELDKNVTSLDYKEGNISTIEIEGKIYETWNKITPVTELRIPLASFKGIDLKNIQEVSLIFNKTQSGSIIVSDFSLK